MVHPTHVLQCFADPLLWNVDVHLAPKD